MISLVVLVNIGIRADSSQRDLIRSRTELNAVTYADHMKADIVRGIDITNTFEQIVISENGKISMFPKVAENMMADYIQSIQIDKKSKTMKRLITLCLLGGCFLSAPAQNYVSQAWVCLLYTSNILLPINLNSIEQLD